MHSLTVVRDINEPCHEKMCLMTYVNNKGADQPARPHSLISYFVVCCLDSTMHVYAKSKVSVAEQASLCHTWLQIPDRFSHDMAQI